MSTEGRRDGRMDGHAHSNTPSAFLPRGKKWIESGHPKNSLEHNSYKECRNKVVKMVREAKRKNLYDGCEKASGDGKKTWKVIRKAMNFKPKPEVAPSFVRTGIVQSNQSNCIYLQG